MLYAEVDKTSCIKSIVRFMRLVRQGDNSNKETHTHTQAHTNTHTHTHTHTHYIPHFTNN